jgi:hypothetical protein
MIFFKCIFNSRRSLFIVQQGRTGRFIYCFLHLCDIALMFVCFSLLLVLFQLVLQVDVMRNRCLCSRGADEDGFDRRDWQLMLQLFLRCCLVGLQNGKLWIISILSQYMLDGSGWLAVDVLPAPICGFFHVGRGVCQGGVVCGSLYRYMGFCARLWDFRHLF